MQRGGVATTVALALLAAGGAQAAPWLQYGYDAARTMATPDAGPATDDVAFEVRLPAGVVEPPIVFDGAIYLATGDPEPGIHRLQVSTGESSRIATLELAPQGFASDGAVLYVSDAAATSAFRASDGSLLWSEPHVLPSENTECRTLVSAGPALYVGCFGRDGATLVASTVVFVTARDAVTGAERWRWVLDADAETAGAASDVPTERSTALLQVAGSISVIDTVVTISTGDIGGPDGADYHTWVLDRETGVLLWSTRHTQPATIQQGVDPLSIDPRRVTRQELLEALAYPTGTRDALYIKLLQEVTAFDPRTGEAGWSFRHRGPDALLVAGGALALRDGELLVASRDVLSSLAVGSSTPNWEATLGPGESFVPVGVLATPEIVYARAALRREGSAGAGAVVDGANLYAYAAVDGQLLWRRALDTPAGSDGFYHWFVVGEGVLVIGSLDGRVVVLGEAPPGLHAFAAAGTEYPAPGEVVRVDLSATTPGAGGPATAFRAEWGDGEVTEWGPDAVLEHTYADAGERRARLQVRNAANQTASAFVTFHVGGEEPNLVSVAFSPEYQERTFFALGLALTAGGALFGVSRIGRRRRLLRRELVAVEEGFGRTRAHPRECEDFLAERRTRANALVMDGKLDEAQFAVLKARIEEHAHDLRAGTVERELGFLPVSTARALQDILADGRVTRWERDHFLAAIDRDTVLTPEQKVKVAALVDAWFARDAP
ncbi:MAG TPA: PQQ-binding-like beta-propeller repeat protein [Candidatus Thermoplasmatota archaeon]|nr:PQQ-binding-like beta-propeller repeat protein [Candidatus Thermoplasmatota archaeon]